MLKNKRVSLQDAYWIVARRKTGKYPESTAQSGKWLVFIGAAKVDSIWKRIKQAVEVGLLGDRAKVSTAKPNPNARDPDRQVICVFTYNYEDIEDVRRIREQLRRLGITEKIAYKADKDTRAGKYRTKGHQQISKFFE
jgi:hypothetical protein